MKKIYRAPQTLRLAVAAQQLLASSVIEVSGNTASVTITDQEYDGVFATKDNAWADIWE